MELLKQIVKNGEISIEGTPHKVLGKVFYTTLNDPNSEYAKILLDDHFVLVISPMDNVAYFGKNEGQLQSFDSLDSIVKYKGKLFNQVNHDYQIVLKIEFGSPVEVEGEVEFWDYECDNEIISIAKVSRDNSRADVIAQYILLKNIKIY